MTKGSLADLVYPELKTTQRLSFTGENFLFWKLKIPFLLADNQFHDLLEPSSPTEPTPMSTDTTCQEVEDGDGYGPAVALILGTLDDHLLLEYSNKYETYNRRTATSIMTSLLTRFDKLRCKMSKIMEYKHHRMAADAHINQHIFRMRAMAKELEDAGVKFPEELPAIVLLNSLPAEWEEDVEGLLRDLDWYKEELNFDNVSRRLRIIRDIRKLRELNNGKKKFKGSCYNCGKHGHYQSDCPNQDAGSSGNNKPTSAYFTFPDTLATPTLTEMIYPTLKASEKLTYDGSNFHIWKRHLHSVFYGNGVKYVLEGPKPSKFTDSASEEDAQRCKKWQADDFTCRHLILGAMDDDLFLSFYDYPTAKALMEALEACFNTTSTARKLVLLKKYINHHMSDHTPTYKHLIKMDLMASKLDNSGIAIPSEMQSVVLLNSLPKSWGEILQGLSVQLYLDNTWSINDVRRRVRDIGHRQEWSAEQNKASVSRQAPSKKYKKVPKGNCYSCGRPGHYQSDCPA